MFVWDLDIPECAPNAGEKNSVGDTYLGICNAYFELQKQKQQQQQMSTAHSNDYLFPKAIGSCNVKVKGRLHMAPEPRVADPWVSS